MLIGDAAGHVSPMTGGGIRLAFELGRRAGQAIADHLADLGPVPETVIARDAPRLMLKGIGRRLLDLAPPNFLIDMALTTPPAQAVARRLYFHRRGGGIAGYAEFEERLRAREAAASRPVWRKNWSG